MGIYDYVLPFLLTFTLVFAVLEKLAILGRDKTNINLVVSMIIGLILVAQPEVTFIINNFIPKVSLFIIVVLMFLIALGTFGGKTEMSGYTMFIALIVSIVAIIWALYPGSIMNMPTWFRPDEREKAWIILIATIVLVVSFVKGSKNPNNESIIEKIGKELTKKGN